MSKISIIIPSYRSSVPLENNLPYLMNFIQDKELDTEVIVVDDGSQDDGETQRIAELFSCKFLSLAQNKIGRAHV